MIILEVRALVLHQFLSPPSVQICEKGIQDTVTKRATGIELTESMGTSVFANQSSGIQLISGLG